MNPREAEREALGKASSRKAPPAGRSWAEARAGWAARWLFPRVAELVCHSQRSFRRNPDRASDVSNHWKNITGNVLAISVLKKGPPDEGRGLILGMLKVTLNVLDWEKSPCARHCWRANKRAERALKRRRNGDPGTVKEW